MPPTSFKELERISNESGVEKALDFLEHNFRRDKEYFKLFEVLKMRCRQQMGLPLMYSQQPDDLDESQQRHLEDGLLAVCREVGTLFLKSGQLQEGWMYLQPVGDKELNEKLIRSIEPDDENIDAVIEIAVSQGAAPAYGYQLLLKHYGTCNGITTFDTSAARFEPAVQQGMAKILLRHLHAELMDNVRYSLNESGSTFEADASLAELMSSYPELTKDGAHHIDTTHLASAMRIARLLEDHEDIEIAKQLASYGGTLAEDFQYPGAPPFEKTYVDHDYFFSALLGDKVDEAIAHFKVKTKSVNAQEYGPVADETLVDLLVRVGRHDDALEVAIERLLGNEESMGIAPSAFEIAKTPDQLGRLMDCFQSKDDLLGYAVALLKLKS
ncbi:MAG: hypothetical protein P8J27_05655 [Mariniblastus sp.]|nr:hypothetical protein [Mariniblastus sp.]